MPPISLNSSLTLSPKQRKIQKNTASVKFDWSMIEFSAARVLMALCNIFTRVWVRVPVGRGWWAKENSLLNTRDREGWELDAWAMGGPPGYYFAQLEALLRENSLTVEMPISLPTSEWGGAWRFRLCGMQSRKKEVILFCGSQALFTEHRKIAWKRPPQLEQLRKVFQQLEKNLYSSSKKTFPQLEKKQSQTAQNRRFQQLREGVLTARKWRSNSSKMTITAAPKRRPNSLKKIVPNSSKSNRSVCWPIEIVIFSKSCSLVKPACKQYAKSLQSWRARVHRMVLVSRSAPL